MRVRISSWRGKVIVMHEPLLALAKKGRKREGERRKGGREGERREEIEGGRKEREEGERECDRS